MIILLATSPILNIDNQRLSEDCECGISLEFCLFDLCCGYLLISSAVTYAAQETQRCCFPPLSFPTANIYHLPNGGHLWHKYQIGYIYQHGKNTFVDLIYLACVHSASVMHQIYILRELSRTRDLN